MARTLAPVGLSADEVKLLSSLLTILAIRAKEPWQLVPFENGADVFLVNKDSAAGKSFMHCCSRDVCIIQYCPNGCAVGQGLCKPLRARDLQLALQDESHKASRGTWAEGPLAWLRQRA